MPLHALLQLGSTSNLVVPIRTTKDIGVMRECHVPKVDRVRRSLAEDLKIEAGTRPGGARLRKVVRSRERSCFGEAKVEPEGFEPSSKRP